MRGAVVVARPLLAEVEPALDHQAGDQGRFWGGERGWSVEGQREAVG